MKKFDVQVHTNGGVKYVYKQGSLPFHEMIFLVSKTDHIE